MTQTTTLVEAAAVAALLWAGAVSGFFFAWVCSTMWGLDAADPRVAIEAMQAMNASVRNAVFGAAFFGTPFVLAGASAAAWRGGRSPSATCFAAAAVLYLAGAFAPTILVNVPMNEALAATPIPSEVGDAAAIWAAYSPRWQAWNLARTVACAGVLVLVGAGVRRLGAR